MSPAAQILVQRGQQRFGPYPAAEVLSLHREQRLLATDLAWHDGMAAWEPLGLVMQRLGQPLPAIGPDSATTWMIPVGRSVWAVAAGYLALFSVLLVFAPLALFCGIMALRSIKRNPGLGGKGRAWFGIIMGALFLIPCLMILFSALFPTP